MSWYDVFYYYYVSHSIGVIRKVSRHWKCLKPWIFPNNFHFHQSHGRIVIKRVLFIHNFKRLFFFLFWSSEKVSFSIVYAFVDALFFYSQIICVQRICKASWVKDSKYNIHLSGASKRFPGMVLRLTGRLQLVVCSKEKYKYAYLS